MKKKEIIFFQIKKKKSLLVLKFCKIIKNVRMTPTLFAYKTNIMSVKVVILLPDLNIKYNRIFVSYKDFTYAS